MKAWFFVVGALLCLGADHGALDRRGELAANGSRLKEEICSAK